VRSLDISELGEPDEDLQRIFCYALANRLSENLYRKFVLPPTQHVFPTGITGQISSRQGSKDPGDKAKLKELQELQDLFFIVDSRFFESKSNSEQLMHTEGLFDTYLNVEDMATAPTFHVCKSVVERYLDACSRLKVKWLHYQTLLAKYKLELQDYLQDYLDASYRLPDNL
jgi:hypothetical protein